MPGSGSDSGQLTRPSVVFQPTAHTRFLRGVQMVVAAVRPTLGPCARTVLVAPESGMGREPAVLESAGVIVRRLTQLAEAGADVGAMYLRHMLWQVHEQSGDGVATAAVLFESILRKGIHALATGCDALRLQRALQATSDVICDALDQQSRPLNGRTAIAAYAASLTDDQPIAALLGEVFDLIGTEGQYEIHTRQRPGLEREYAEGMVFQSTLLSHAMFTDLIRMRTQAEQVAVLISDLSIDDPRELVPLLECVVAAGKRTLLLIVDRLGEQPLTLLHANQQAGVLTTIAVRPPGLGAQIPLALDDLAVVLGGRVFSQAAGDSLRTVIQTDLGHARRVWAHAHAFGVAGGSGDRRKLRTHIASLRALYRTAHDRDMQQATRDRIGRLLGGSAAMYIGAATTTETELRKAQAERMAHIVCAAIGEGVVPGGGMALYRCQLAIDTISAGSGDLEQQAAWKIVRSALEAPARTIMTNAGHDAEPILYALQSHAVDIGYDVLNAAYVNMYHTGILDAVATQKCIVRMAIEAAALALTIEAQIHRRQPEVSIQP